VVVSKTGEFEMWALGQPWGLPPLAASLAVLRTTKDPDELRFEEEPSDRLVQLGLSGI
jgi:hypothetical protein